MYNFDTGRGHEAAKARGSLKISTRVRKNSVVWLSVKVNFSFKSVSIFCLPSPKHTPMLRIHYLYMYTIDILKMRYFHKKKFVKSFCFGFLVKFSERSSVNQNKKLPKYSPKIWLIWFDNFLEEIIIGTSTLKRVLHKTNVSMFLLYLYLAMFVLNMYSVLWDKKGFAKWQIIDNINNN